MKKKSILVIGPMPEPTTGVSLANKVLVEGLSSHDAYQIKVVNTSLVQFKENLGKFSLSKFFFYLKQNLYVFKVFCVDIVYITPGQTFFGLTKYYLYFVLTRLLRKELIVHIHGNHIGEEYRLLKGLKKIVFSFLLKKISKGIVLSESLTGNMTPFISDDKIYISYNFVEDYLFVEKQMIKNKLKGIKPKVVFLSNLMEEKGIYDLLDALKILEDKGVDYEARIAGNIDASQEQKLKAEFKRLKKTSYIGVVSGKPKRDLLLWANIFILPTFYKMEGQPISILEAMATANIILTTRHAGIPDIFQNETNGYFVEKKKPTNIANQIQLIDLRSTQSQKISWNNYLNARKKYRQEKFINNIIDIFEAQ
tara:strand:+ start:6386 stop:7483 length:1098 start_codon:yes stop_codon:yes gene_type:complete